jgi:lipopolysaccharide export system protein LptA
MIAWKKHLALGSLCLALHPNIGLALESDKKQPTKIDANQMVYNEKAQVNVFSGNVLLTRGSLVIRGEKLTLSEKDGHQFAKVEGGPSNFKQQRDSNKKDEVLMIDGSANLIEYDGAKSTVTLTGNAKLQKSANGQLTESISGNKIVYQQNTESLNVVGGGGEQSESKSRVQAIFKPRSDKAE